MRKYLTPLPLLSARASIKLIMCAHRCDLPLCANSDAALDSDKRALHHLYVQFLIVFFSCLSPLFFKYVE